MKTEYLQPMTLSYRNKLVALFMFLLLILMLGGCESVKPYQRAYLNDENMKPGAAPCETLDQNVFSYREGSLVTGGSKTRGGCGCN